jgi:hypothetical protein
MSSGAIHSSRSRFVLVIIAAAGLGLTAGVVFCIAAGMSFSRRTVYWR